MDIEPISPDELEVLKLALTTAGCREKHSVRALTCFGPHVGRPDRPAASDTRPTIQGLQESTITDWQRKNASRYPVERLIADGSIMSIADSALSESLAYVEFSRMGFSDDGLQALIYFGQMFGRLVGHGGYTLFTRTERGWVVAGGAGLWIS